MHTLSPDRLLQAGFGFRSAKALLVAVELGVFTELGRGPRSSFQLCRALALDERAAPDLLDALVAMGVLDREGDDERAVYLNTREAGHFLDRRSPAYIGTLLESASKQSYPGWAELRAALEKPTARPPRLAPVDGSNAVPGSVLDAFAARFDFSAHRTVACIGADAGRFAERLAARQPQLVCHGVDLQGSWPAVDLIMVAGVLHTLDAEARVGFIRRSHAALPEGGGLVAIGPLVDEARRHNLFALLASLDARLGAGDACGFSASDFAAACRAAGFARSEVIALGETASAAVARK